ncbi:MAG: molybdopterin converting factor subunit 1 [Anaerolineales bacterium]|jgi:molybdopterin synthase catalytic subunit
MNSPEAEFEATGEGTGRAGLRVRVLFFATLRDRIGASALEVELGQAATVADLKALLAGRHPALRNLLDTAVFARNREFAFAEEALQEGDEVAVFPPVSGGRERQPTLIRVTDEALDLEDLIRQIALPTTGATCLFTGLVRSQNEGEDPKTTEYLEYQAYLPMAEAKLRQLALEIRSRWPAVEGIALIQRIGRLKVGTPTVVVACSAAHRDSGVFEAARYGIDRLKEIVPVWKREVGPTGEAWVEGHYRPTARDRQGPAETDQGLELMG